MEPQKQNPLKAELDLFISAATDLSKRTANQDAYGFSDGCEIILSGGQDRTFHERLYENITEFMAVIADGVSSAQHTEKTEEDAAALITKNILEDLFDELSLDIPMYLIADEINDTMIHASDACGKKLAAAVSMIGIYPDLIKILSMGDTTIMRFQNGKAELITPLPVTSVLNEYAGNPFCPGRKMADLYQLKPQFGDIYMLATDGLIHGFTDRHGIIQTEKIYQLLQRSDFNAKALVEEAKRTSGDNISACVIHITETAD